MRSDLIGHPPASVDALESGPYPGSYQWPPLLKQQVIPAFLNSGLRLGKFTLGRESGSVSKGQNWDRGVKATEEERFDSIPSSLKME